MNLSYFVGEDFDQVSIQKVGEGKCEYEGCTFNNVNFTNKDLRGCVFTDCKFLNCDLSMAKISDTAFQDAKFVSCKLMGLHFDECNRFSLSFEFADCILDYSSFFKLKLKKTIFKNCKLIQVDFVESDFSQSKFINCDLAQSIFERSKLEKVDFRTSFGFSIDPENNKITNAKFSSNSLPGLLLKYKIVVD